jgi:hypothetical protein
MDEGRARSAKAIFLEATEAPEGQRAAILDRACAGDASLRAEVEDLLEVYAGAGRFLRAPESGGPPALAPAGEGPGSRIGPYRLIEQIGEGGFGATAHTVVAMMSGSRIPGA